MAKVLNKTKGFGSISRDCVYDNELSDRARFLYVYMACKPEGWEFYQDKVAEELGYKKDTLRKYLDELITRGWITELEQHNDGKFGCLEYIIEIERCDGNLPIRKKPDTEKTRNGKNPNQRNIDSISSDISISSDKRDIEEKSISNDIPKSAYSDDFQEFWEAYGYCRDKGTTYKRWKNLSKKDKEAALKALPEYFADCKRCDRKKRYPAVYLSKRTWEDDFSTQIKEEEKEELPAGLTPETWALRQGWMYKFIPRIAEKITPDMFLTLQGLSHFKPDVFKDIIEDIDKSDFNGDIVTEFDRLRLTDNYASRIDL